MGDKKEFVGLMNDPEIKTKMEHHGIKLEERDIDRTWEILTGGDESAELDIHAFYDGLGQHFRVLQEGLEAKHVADVNYKLKRLNLVIDEDMQTMEERADTLLSQQDELLKHIHTQQKIFAQQWSRFLQKQSQDAMEALEEAANLGS